MSDFTRLTHSAQRLAVASAFRLRVRRAGCLSVRHATVWVTVDGEAKDRVMQPGDTLALSSGHQVVVEPWAPAEMAELVWQPQRAPAPAEGARWLTQVWRAWPARLFNAPASPPCDQAADHRAAPAG